MTAESNLVVQSCSWDPELRTLGQAGSFPAVLTCPAAACPLVLVLTISTNEGFTARSLSLYSSARNVEVSSQEYDGRFSYIDTYRGDAATVRVGEPPVWATIIPLPYSTQSANRQHSVNLQLKLLSIQPSKQQCVIAQLGLLSTTVLGPPAATATGPVQTGIAPHQLLQSSASRSEASSTAAATGGGGGGGEEGAGASAKDAGLAPGGAEGAQAGSDTLVDSTESTQEPTAAVHSRRLEPQHEVEMKGSGSMQQGQGSTDPPALSQVAQLRLLLQHAAGDAAATASTLPASLQSLASKLPSTTGSQGGKSLGGLTGMLQAVAKAAAQNALSAQQRVNMSDVHPTPPLPYTQQVQEAQPAAFSTCQAGSGTGAGLATASQRTGGLGFFEDKQAPAVDLSLPAFGFCAGQIQDALQRMDTHIHRMSGVAEQVDKLLGCMQRVEQHLLHVDTRMSAIEAALASRPLASNDIDPSTGMACDNHEDGAV